MNRIAVIKSLLQRTKAKVYVEIGVDTGYVFFSLNAPVKAKIAVDPEFRFSFRAWLRTKLRPGNAKYFQVTSDQFFADQKEMLRRDGIDVAFVDGLHTYKQCYQDIVNCLEYLNDGGFIVVHDVNPPNAACESPVGASQQEVLAKAERGEIPDWTGAWTGDVWKSIAMLRTRKDLQVFTIDSDWGIGVITKGTPESVLDVSIPAIEAMSYADLEKNRYELINLKPSHYFFEFLQEKYRK
ncbi:Predicted O-methyltransferase YrrM [Chitinophaga ginsengisegetis]|jgi:Methyltransferase domain|uniref:Predicted O-methyltransferase YrrM n=1 Tax=Chitinophaga ginsengisegetis TaxID=393003 RepID=A0A1T5PAD7_9BACT|nr:class I SAM-dependent methyltransferase [Chitinophaga ginsengisegetis]MDR6569911.1 hypothetical protein [Chitinophaga ginsengisegetis]MDR6649644.1 hypothetical protein [Chitinophaga ginsengisegetis]MDR6656153.1 hypothetical protein [Chitinophaga ginsengisegetis]SKD09700.1 Predicted O-methyltransferase YrrM [Chitinophaga ginsengisegetis]